MQMAKATVRLLRSTRYLSMLENFPSGSRAFSQSALCSDSTPLDKQEVTNRVLNLLSASQFIDPSRSGGASNSTSSRRRSRSPAVKMLTCSIPGGNVTCARRSCNCSRYSSMELVWWSVVRAPMGLVRIGGPKRRLQNRLKSSHVRPD
ncbi:hypothetical protein KSP39_PZI011465 [Platanthera zijinensis]|uniref:Uncharacterized protein n=1 Tax=Platanthera zijinensis TaxID=2320716 RepID=A0AAP0BHG5_9ASPA